MTTNTAGPPQRRRSGPRQEAAHAAHIDATHTKPPRPAEQWRHGYAYGFRAALRLAARELGPETWTTLDELADRYDLAAP